MPEELESPKALEIGRLLFAKPCQFTCAATALEQLPQMDAPEVAFAGRSNVGKSSLINALVGQKALARTSQTPGRTKQLNFFEIENQLTLVDLPGYGFARAAKTDIKAWTNLTLAFLKGRATLRRVFLLIDSRRGIGESDRSVMKILDEAAVSWGAVLTKSDKLTASETEAITNASLEEIASHTAAWQGVFLTSAQKGTGIAQLRAHIATLAR